MQTLTANLFHWVCRLELLWNLRAAKTRRQREAPTRMAAREQRRKRKRLQRQMVYMLQPKLSDTEYVAATNTRGRGRGFRGGRGAARGRGNQSNRGRGKLPNGTPSAGPPQGTLQ